MKEEELKQIEIKLEENLIKSSEIYEKQLNWAKDKLDEETGSIINNYTKEIRNILITSGVVAPFSLKLLDIESLNINLSYLLVGFFLLLFNIAISSFLMNKMVKDKDTTVTKALMYWIFAESNSKEVKDKSKNYNERVDKSFEYMENIDKVNEALGFSYLNMKNEREKVILRKYNRISMLIFSLGITFIMLSTAINYLIELISNNIGFLI